MPSPPPELLALSERLCTRIVNAIERDGPLPFSRFMDMALYEPGLGYYVNGLHKFGREGDFVTAPELGALFAQALAGTISRVGAEIGDGAGDGVGDEKGASWTLLELGPGSGALAAALLPALDPPPARYLLLEPSAALREVQRERLDALPANLARRVEWLDQPPASPFDGVVLANEVLDALPVARFRVTEHGIAELCVEFADARFGWTERPPGARLCDALDRLQRVLPAPLPAGYESELNVDLGAWMDTVLEPLRRGLALFVDYGYPRTEYYHADRSEGTLVCHYRHRAHFDPFVWPGLTDLSAFVDFSAAADAGRALGFELAGFASQADFVLGSGVHSIIEQAADERRRLTLAAEFKRLVLPGQMGEKFKLLALARGLDRFGGLPGDRRERL